MANLSRMKLDDIVERVRRERKWSPKQAADAELWYRRFLALTVQNGGRPIFGISEKSDYLWHEHITFTRRYRNDCARYIGRFVDHNPTTPGMRKRLKSRLEHAKALYVKAYGSHPIDMSVPCY